MLDKHMLNMLSSENKDILILLYIIIIIIIIIIICMSTITFIYAIWYRPHAALW